MINKKISQYLLLLDKIHYNLFLLFLDLKNNNHNYQYQKCHQFSQFNQFNQFNHNQLFFKDLNQVLQQPKFLLKN